MGSKSRRNRKKQSSATFGRVENSGCTKAGAGKFKLAAPRFSSLPDEIALQIFQHLDVVSRFQLRSVSKKWDSLLRTESAFESVKLDEKAFLKYHEDDREDYVSHFLDKLSKADVWKSVKFLHLDGSYELSNQKPHGGDCPYTRSRLFDNLMDKIYAGKRLLNGDFAKLTTISTCKVAVELDKFNNLQGNMALHCRLIVSNGSLAFERYDYFPVEFDIPVSKTFDLSGRTVWLRRDPDLHLSNEDDGYGIIPVEIGEFIVEQCNSVPSGIVSRLGDLYAGLLKGREGLGVRGELQQLFMETFEYDESGYDPDEPHWAQCKDYDFSDLDKMTKYTLVYYARPRNCYQIYRVWEDWEYVEDYEEVIHEL